MENEIVLLRLFFFIGTIIMTLSIIGVMSLFFVKKKKTTASGQENKNLIKFTQRELEVLKLIAEGLKPREVADSLCISPRTLNTHKQNIQKKYDFNNITSAVIYCVQRKIIVLDKK